MSDQNKHIDRIFQESFKHFEAEPSSAVWNKIQKEIKPKKKRIIPFWFKSAGIAASLLLAFGLGYWLQPNPINQQSSFSNFNVEDAKIEMNASLSTSFDKASQFLLELIEESKSLGRNEQENSFLNTNLVSNTNAVKNKNGVNQQETASTEVRRFDFFNIGFVNSDSDKNQYQFNSDAFNSLSESNKQKINSGLSDTFQNEIAAIEKTDQKRQFDAFFSDEQDDVVESETNTNKWFLKPVISPIFNAGQNSSAALGQEVASNSSSGDLSFSYGMQVGFKLNNKWSIRTGINQVNTSYTTENVIFAPSANAFLPDNQSSVYGLFSQEYYDANVFTGETRIFSEEGSLSQQMGFVEIPLEVEYAILDGKFGISFTGGASTLLLTDNNLMMNTSSGSLNIGESQNMNQTSFSTNIGLGINYQLSRKLRFNVEPALKYQINTFQGSNLNFNPYFFGVYSGLQFQF